MPDHDPLAEALRASELAMLHAPAIRAALDAAGYEVRPKLTAERLAIAIHKSGIDGCAEHEPGQDAYVHEFEAAAILAIIDGADDATTT